MHYIETLREGERVNEIYLCKNKQSALTKAGKPYEALILQDKTGTLDAKIWEPGSVGIDDFDRFDYINVVGDITSFQGALQLNVKRVRKATEGEYEPKEYLPVSEYNVDEMYEQLTGYIKRWRIRTLRSWQAVSLSRMQILQNVLNSILRQKVYITVLWADF